jgi:hypothetical protein
MTVSCLLYPVVAIDVTGIAEVPDFWTGTTAFFHI